jgi:uncharacterized protein YdeI (YjbR/CyaY-like superfamily)
MPASNRDPRVDAYIAKAQPFARPILEAIRATVHAHPAEIGEAIKWGMPMFTYKGANLCHMAAFKAHASFGFWRREAAEADIDVEKDGMGMFGKLTGPEQLPDAATIGRLIDEAIARIDAGGKTPRPARTQPPRQIQSETPSGLADALAGNAAAKATYDALPPGAKRDYDDWIAEAKRDETRAKRVNDAITWLTEGKKRYWKYDKC